MHAQMTFLTFFPQQRIFPTPRMSVATTARLTQLHKIYGGFSVEMNIKWRVTFISCTSRTTTSFFCWRITSPRTPESCRWLLDANSRSGSILSHMSHDQYRAKVALRLAPVCGCSMGPKGRRMEREKHLVFNSKLFPPIRLPPKATSRGFCVRAWVSRWRIRTGRFRRNCDLKRHKRR